jgi:hypothetical protein
VLYGGIIFNARHSGGPRLAIYSRDSMTRRVRIRRGRGDAAFSHFGRIPRTGMQENQNHQHSMPAQMTRKQRQLPGWKTFSWGSWQRALESGWNGSNFDWHSTLILLDEANFTWRFHGSPWMTKRI